MKVHINQIPPEGLLLEGEEPAEILGLETDGLEAKALSPIRYQLNVGLSEGGLFATGRLEVDLELECGTCLNKFVYPLCVPDFAMQTELGGSETVDLTPFLREDIFLALPPYPHCDWNGRITCEGVKQATAERDEVEAPSAWNALDQLKLKSKQ